MNGFQFNTDKFDFWPVYEAIKKYYPIGVEAAPKLYHSYPGQIALANIVIDRVHNDENFTSLWRSVENKLKQSTGKEIIGTTYGQDFCYSASLIVDTETHNNFTHRKLLHFFVSFLGPFYSIIGESQNELVMPQKDKVPSRYCSTNYLVASPHDEFAALFNTVEQAVEAAFENYKFVPYWINEQEITGLYLHHQNENKSPTVFNALFNDHIDLRKQQYRQQGDPCYRHEDWIKPGYDTSQEGHWTVHPPLSALTGTVDKAPGG
ncbi:hypothetical protein [Niabella soli]|uniref:Uncharacterized protein n=1 Tax=Niabella soli DSM 19437 TaxID=929713 RepID=W0F2S0_9BACT|nr:hypothetical protein [Niabella soli]AHF15784.1 hypothetical protein NIASO_12680 [Niabella soli DSM 19437]